MRLVKAIPSLLVSLSMLFIVNSPVLAAGTNPSITNGLCSGVNLSFNSDCKQLSTSGANKKFTDIAHTIVNLLSIIVGVVAVIMIIIGGLRYITSGGSDTSVTGAKNTILYAVIGLIIVALAQLIVQFILRRVNG